MNRMHVLRSHSAYGIDPSYTSRQGIYLKIQGLKVSPVPRQASASKAFKGPAWKGRGDACKNYTPFLLDLGEKNNQKCDIPYVL
ncbi:hypothetical protein NC652_017991 [Populus alba x Populus x berolinensis]|nr:hypothetical protein NC652_017991 [Populus alba x Populus x berolinensis]